MSRGFAHVLLYALPALLVSGIAALLLFGAAAGALWLFVFGDNPWPQTAQTALGFGFGAAWLSLWIAMLLLAFSRGQARDPAEPLPKRDFATAAGVTILALAVFALYQRSVGNLGPPSDGEICATFCQAKGYSGSSMPPRNAGSPTCSCLDPHGRETVTVPIGEATPARGR